MNDQEKEAASRLITVLLDGLVLINRAGRICYANKAAIMLLDHPEAELLDSTYEEALGEILLRAHAPAQLQNALALLDTATGPIQLELTIAGVSREGDKELPEERFLRLTFFPVPPPPTEADPATQEWSWGLQIHDATPDRTADQLKNEFVAVVSHELRTPLSAMQGFSELLLTQDASPERRRTWLEMINRESVRLSSLIDDMLSLSRIESGRVDLRLERVELEPVVRQCVEILRVGSSKHSFKIEIEENLPAVRADRDKIIQIFNNIIGNAIKYSTKGGQIVIKVGSYADDTNMVRVSVTDQGIGISAEELPKVFEKFYRVSGTPAKEVKGTGLGLAITRQLIDLMSGSIWVESTVGKGSTFYFTLPVHTFPDREIRAFKNILLNTLLLPHKDTTEAELYLDYLQRTLPSGQLDSVLRQCLYEVGEKWKSGEIGVGDEHLATGLIRDFLSRMRSTSTSSNGLRMVIGGVAGEEHVAGITVVANAYGRAGWNVTNLGANVPVSAFITTLAQVQPDILLLSIAMSQRLIEIKRVVQEVREAFPNLIIGIGGRLFNDLPDLAQRLDADFQATSPDETVRLGGEAIRIRQEQQKLESNEDEL